MESPKVSQVSEPQRSALPRKALTEPSSNAPEGAELVASSVQSTASQKFPSDEPAKSRLLDARRLYEFLVGLIGVALLALCLSIYMANGLLAAKSKKIEKTKLESIVLYEKLQQVAKARADITRYKSLADIAKDIVPQDKDQAQTIREITRMAEANSVKLGTIFFPGSSLGDNKIPHSQLVADENIPGVYSLKITVESDATAPASYSDVLNFLDALEHNRRTALVNSISIQPLAGQPDKLSFTLTLSEYVKP